jgi:hypothetical protein
VTAGTLKLLRNCVTLFGLTASALTVATASVAQPRNPYGGGSRLPQKPEFESTHLDSHQSRVVLQRFSECLAKKRPADVQKYLLEQLDERGTLGLRMKVLRDAPACLRADRMQILPLTLQGALADAMLRQQNLLVQAIDVSAIPPLLHSSLEDNSDSWRKANTAERQLMIAMDYLFHFGECVVRADVADAYALAASEPDSSQESAAFERLMPAFGNCVEKNRTLQGGKTEIRSVVVYNYYRLAAATHPQNLVIAGKK